MKKILLLISLIIVIGSSCKKSNQLYPRHYQDGSTVWVRLGWNGQPEASLTNGYGQKLTEPLTVFHPNVQSLIDANEYCDICVGANGDTCAYWERNLTNKQPKPWWQHILVNGKADSTLIKIDQ